MLSFKRDLRMPQLRVLAAVAALLQMLRAFGCECEWWSELLCVLAIHTPWESRALPSRLWRVSSSTLKQRRVCLVGWLCVNRTEFHAPSFKWSSFSASYSQANLHRLRSESQVGKGEKQLRQIVQVIQFGTLLPWAILWPNNLTWHSWRDGFSYFFRGDPPTKGIHPFN